MPASMRLLWLLRLFCSCARVVFVVVFLPHSCSRVTLLSVGQAVMALVSTSCNSLAAVRCSCCARHARGGVAARSVVSSIFHSAYNAVLGIGKLAQK